MNQAYFTFCCTGTGKSVSGLGGDRARAAAKGTSESELTAYKQYCCYPQYSNRLKSDLESETASGYDPFAKLVCSFVKVDNAKQRFLSHSVYASPDKETLREGNYFSHLLYSLPDSWSVRTALEMWGSPFWVTQDSDNLPTELPPVDEKNIPFGIINERSFVEFLCSSEERQKKFLFLIKGLLTIDSNEKIVLTGVPEDAAFCLWGATRCLPSAIWETITFSTHEIPAMSFSFDVVNFPFGGNSESQDVTIFRELPNCPNTLFYSESSHFASSQLPDVCFASDILKICVKGEFHILDAFYKAIPAARKLSGLELQLFWKFISRPDQISFSDINAALKIPELKRQTIEMIMDNSRYSLNEQLRFYPALDASRQDALLNRLISENSIEQIRSNAAYSKLLTSALTIPEEPKIPEKKPSFFQRLFH